MSTINKVPASAGAEWLLAGFALLKRAPVPLIGMALLWQFLALIAGLIAIGVPSLGIALQIVLILAQPLFLGGLMWVIRELDEGRAIVPSSNCRMAGWSRRMSAPSRPHSTPKAVPPPSSCSSRARREG